MPPCAMREAVVSGFNALGWRCILRGPDHYVPGQREPFDAIAVDGLHGARRDVIADYTAAGIQALVFDMGFVRRDKYHYVGLGGLNRIPATASADRWRALGVSLARPSKGGDTTVIAGQKIGDAAHPFDSRAEMERWAVETAKQCTGKVVFRPHPLSPDVAPQGLELDGLPLASSLARASKVIAWTSNIGHDALLAGVEAVACGPAAWQGVTLRGRREYFQRLAYAQWTLPEIASGEAIRFVLDAA